MIRENGAGEFAGDAGLASGLRRVGSINGRGFLRITAPTISVTIHLRASLSDSRIGNNSVSIRDPPERIGVELRDILIGLIYENTLILCDAHSP